MNDIIRKAVELAEGWSLAEIDGRVYTPNTTGWMDWPEKMNQHDLDALAAQLVRQVDALEGVSFQILAYEPLVAQVYNEDESVDVSVTGSDRTMNTLKCIVESGVLDET